MRYTNLHLAVALVALSIAVRADDTPPLRQVALIAGPASHAFSEHEPYAGLKVLGDLLNAQPELGVRAVVHKGWPKAADLTNVAAIVVMADGGPDGLLPQHLGELDPVLRRKVGLGVLHWALDVPAGEPGERLRGWIGGCYETNWSVNPKWEARFEQLPAHPITRGVRPFKLHDEWYYHMRFCADMAGVTPLLWAVPPDATREDPDGPHSGNPVVRSRKGQPEHLAWAYVRAGGGRGFGYSGGHKQWNLAHDDARKLLLNALVWLAGGEVPADGVRSPRPDMPLLLRDLEKPAPPKLNLPRFERMLGELNAPLVESAQATP